jgi:hypothetical protein
MLELLGGEDSNFTFSNITEKRARREERGGGNEILFYVIEYGIMFVICARERARVERIVSTPRQIARRVNEWVEQSMFLSFDPLVCFGRDDMTNMLVTSISEDSRGGGEEGKRKHRGGINIQRWQKFFCRASSILGPTAVFSQPFIPPPPCAIKDISHMIIGRILAENSSKTSGREGARLQKSGFDGLMTTRKLNWSSETCKG